MVCNGCFFCLFRTETFQNVFCYLFFIYFQDKNLLLNTNVTPNETTTNLLLFLRQEEKQSNLLDGRCFSFSLVYFYIFYNKKNKTRRKGRTTTARKHLRLNHYNVKAATSKNLKQTSLLTSTGGVFFSLF